MHKRLMSLFAVLLSFVLAATCTFPLSALAAQPEVRMEGNTGSSDAATAVSSLVIGDVEAPRAGLDLDGIAVVSSAEGASWEIPVLWVGSDWQLATKAVEGQSYLPALVFYLPTDYAVQDADETGGYTITLSDDLVGLFGSQDIISVYDSSTGITYILPAALRDFFAQASLAKMPNEPLGIGDGTTQNPNYTGPVAADSNGEESADGGSDIFDSAGQEDLGYWVDIYCAQTAKDVLSQDDLEYLVDLIINKLHPQAVNLLLEKFPAFRHAEELDWLGRQIGLYIYYESGDKDGDSAHEDVSGALAYVNGKYIKDFDGSVRYAYVIGVDVSSLADYDDAGRLVLIRDGQDAVTFENTIVHEMFHAFMDDYNRIGMAGVNSPDSPDALSDEVTDSYLAIRYPLWFIEGSASAVENTYQYRHDYFEYLRRNPNNPNEYLAVCTDEVVFANFTGSAENDGEAIGYGLRYAENGKFWPDDDKQVSTTPSRYVSGYLAVLYLGELAARKDASVGSSVSRDGNTVVINSENIRYGLNSILERMHEGETLDQIIYDISPVDSRGVKMYLDTAHFESKFIYGDQIYQEDSFKGDYETGASLEFVTAYLNYMKGLEQQSDREHLPNGSILFDFSVDYDTPLDRTKSDSTEVYQIAESNTFVTSTVPDDVALAGGGKSEGGMPMAGGPAQDGAGNMEGNDDGSDLPLAAKAENDSVEQDATNQDETVASQEQTAASEEPHDTGSSDAEASNAPMPAAEAPAAEDSSEEARTTLD